MKLLTMKPVKNLSKPIRYIPQEIQPKLIGDLKYHKESKKIVSNGTYPEYYTEIVSKRFVEGTPEKVFSSQTFIETFGKI